MASPRPLYRFTMRSFPDDTCGIPFYDPITETAPRIIGGIEARPHSWPWTVAVTILGVDLFSMSIINV